MVRPLLALCAAMLSACGSTGESRSEPRAATITPTATARATATAAAPAPASDPRLTPAPTQPAPPLGAGPELALAPDPSPAAPDRLSATDATTALIVDGGVIVWGNHPDHIPYRVEHVGPVR